MLRARMATPAPGAQWTGITTRLAERLLETAAVDAVLKMGPDANDKWRPKPVIVIRSDGVGPTQEEKPRAE